MLRQLDNLLLGSKDAPRPPLSNALGFVSFGPLPESLRSHLWTVVFKKKHKICVYASFFKKKIKMFITLIKRREMGNWFIWLFINLKDAPRPPLSNALCFVSFVQLPESLRSHLWTPYLRRKPQKTNFLLFLI